MTLSDILAVEETFLIEGRGLAVAPLLPAPRHLSSVPFRVLVRVETPEGAASDMEAQLCVEHFRLRGGESKWGTMVVLPGASKGDVPRGSRILIDRELLATLPEGVAPR